MLTAAVMGLLGGGHCLAMCGGIVSAVSAAGRRPRLGLQIGYNAGRVFSYAMAGSLAGAFGAAGLLAGSVFPIQMVLIVAANALVVLLGLHLAGWGRLVMQLESAGAAVWRRISPAGKLFLPADTPVRAMALGMIWGWLPCGLVYSALALALVAGNPMRGALVLIAFGLGTLPNLLVAGLAAQQLRLALRTRWMRTLAGGVIVALGVAGLARAPGLGEAIRSGILCVIPA